MRNSCKEPPRFESPAQFERPSQLFTSFKFPIGPPYCYCRGRCHRCNAERRRSCPRSARGVVHNTDMCSARRAYEEYWYQRPAWRWVLFPRRRPGTTDRYFARPVRCVPCPVPRVAAWNITSFPLRARRRVRYSLRPRSIPKSKCGPSSGRFSLYQPSNVALVSAEIMPFGKST